MSTVLIRREYWEADVYTCCACVIHRGKTQEDTVRRWSSPSQGERPQRKPSLQTPWSWTSQPLEWRARKFLLFRPPRLWYCCGSPGTLNMWYNSSVLIYYWESVELASELSNQRLERLDHLPANSPPWPRQVATGNIKLACASEWQLLVADDFYLIWVTGSVPGTHQGWPEVRRAQEVWCILSIWTTRSTSVWWCSPLVNVES